MYRPTLICPIVGYSWSSSSSTLCSFGHPRYILLSRSWNFNTHTRRKWMGKLDNKAWSIYLRNMLLLFWILVFHNHSSFLADFMGVIKTSGQTSTAVPVCPLFLLLFTCLIHKSYILMCKFDGYYILIYVNMLMLIYML